MSRDRHSTQTGAVHNDPRPIIEVAIECGVNLDEELENIILCRYFHMYDVGERLLQVGAHMALFVLFPSHPFRRRDVQTMVFSLRDRRCSVFQLYQTLLTLVLSSEDVVRLVLSYCCGDSYTGFRYRRKDKRLSKYD